MLSKNPTVAELKMALFSSWDGSDVKDPRRRIQECIVGVDDDPDEALLLLAEVLVEQDRPEEAAEAIRLVGDVWAEERVVLLASAAVLLSKHRTRSAQSQPLLLLEEAVELLDETERSEERIGGANAIARAFEEIGLPQEGVALLDKTVFERDEKGGVLANGGNTLDESVELGHTARLMLRLGGRRRALLIALRIPSFFKRLKVLAELTFSGR